jgi:hypothetical protein
MNVEKFAILDLKPAQIAVGLLEVEHRMQDYAEMSKDEFHAYTAAHPVPVVKSNHGYYIIDHHHLCRAYHELGHKNIFIYQQADFSSFDTPKFWSMMESASWVLPQDQYGTMHPYHQLPFDIRGMADDPYRSLVWKLKELGLWQKVDVPFAEFKLANFLRGKIEILNTCESFDLAVKNTVQYLKSAPKSELEGIPGLVGK